MPLTITAQKLDQWSNEQAAQALLPVLMRRLVWETIPQEKIKKIDFPGFENVTLPGVDGHLTTTANHAYAPCGKSVWECGTGKNVRKKAEDDFKNRNSKPDPDTTFVFVSSRNWPDKDKWVEEKKNHEWKEVIAFDANDLEQWLEQAPATTIWLSEQIGVAQSNLETAESFLNEWQTTSKLKIPCDLLFNNREIAKQTVEKFLQDEKLGDNLSVVADTQDEAVAFTCAVLQRHCFSERPTIILKNKDAVDEITKWKKSFDTPFLLIAHSEDVADEIPMHLRNSSMLIIADVRQGSVQGLFSEEGDNKWSSSVTLARVKNFDSFNELNTGLDYYKRTGGSISALRRTLCKRKPKWAKLTGGDRNFIWLVLLGSWDELFDGDRDIICNLSEFDKYEGWEGFIQDLIEAEESPLQRTSYEKKRYRLFSRVDAFLIISRKIKKEDVRKFLREAKTVFCEGEPIFRSKSYGDCCEVSESRYHSVFLRQGIADGLAILNLYRGSLDGINISTEISHFYDDIFKCKDSWFYLADILPTLAEASPDNFIQKLNDALRENDGRIDDLFRPPRNADETDYAYPELLRALEKLAWNKNEFESSICLLCELQDRFAEPIANSRIKNSPNRSMEHILQTWKPQTSANNHQRKAIFTDLYHKYPQQISKVAMAIADNYKHQWVHFTSRPVWRDDALNIMPMTHDERVQMFEAAIGTVITYIKDKEQDVKSQFKMAEKALANFEFWGAYFSGIDFTQLAVEAICSLPRDDSELSQSLSEEARKTLFYYDKTSENADNSKRYKRIRNLLNQIRKKFEPEDLPQKYAYLFALLPQLERDGTHETREDRIDCARSKAVAEILNQPKQNDSLFEYPDLIKLLELSEDPSALSEVLFKNYISEGKFDLNAYLFACLKSDVNLSKLKRHVNFLFGWSKGNNRIPDALETSKTISIIEKVIQKLGDDNDINQLTEKKVILLHALRIDENQGREYIDHLSDEMRKLYFSEYRLWRPLECETKNTPESGWLADGYIKYKHPRLGWEFFRGQNISFEKQLELLEAIFIVGKDNGEDRDPFPQSYAIEALLKNALERGNSDHENRLFEIEFKFFRFLDYIFTKEGGIFVVRHIARNPSFLIKLAKYIYQTDNGEDAYEGNNQSDREAYNHTSFDILNKLNFFSKYFPWVIAEKKIDEVSFFEWVKSLRQFAKEEKMLNAVDKILGKGLSKEFVSNDNLLPLPIAQEILEKFNSSRMLAGFKTGRFNSRGILSSDGTLYNLSDERKHSTRNLAEHYDSLSRDVQANYPIVAAVMRDLAETYRSEAEVERRMQDTDSLDL